MSGEDAPRLYMDKPKKALLKHQASSRSSSSSSMTPSASTGSIPRPPIHRPPKASFARRYKFLWPMLLTLNFSIGAYILLMPKTKDEVAGKVEASQVPNASPVSENKEFR